MTPGRSFPRRGALIGLVPLLFFLLFVLAQNPATFAELPEGHGPAPLPMQHAESPPAGNPADQDKCERAAQWFSLIPDSTTRSCEYRLYCEGWRTKMPSHEDVLENDYLTQLFLHKNDILLSSARTSYPNSFVPSVVVTMEIKRDSALTTTFNVCNDLVYYTYRDYSVHMPEAPDGHLKLFVPMPGTGKWNTEEAGQKKYEIAVHIMERHLSPKIQVREFYIPPDEVRCNEGLGLYMRGGNTPVCIKPQTYEVLLGRGLGLGPPSGSVQSG